MSPAWAGSPGARKVPAELRRKEELRINFCFFWKTWY